MKKRCFKIAVLVCMLVMTGNFILPKDASAATAACGHKHTILGYDEKILYDMTHTYSYEMDVDGDGEMETVTNVECHVIIKLCTPTNFCLDCGESEVSDLMEPHKEETHTEPCGMVFKDILP